MGTQEICDNMKRLIAEEHELRGTSGAGSAERAARLTTLEGTLDQCWDLLRQRQALREAGQDPEKAHVRSLGTVENYQQ